MAAWIVSVSLPLLPSAQALAWHIGDPHRMSVDWISERGHRNLWKENHSLKGIMKALPLVGRVRCWTAVDQACKGRMNATLVCEYARYLCSSKVAQSFIPVFQKIPTLSSPSWYLGSWILLSNCSQTLILLRSGWQTLRLGSGSGSVGFPG